MRPLVFADLDDTLFQTARKMTVPPRPDRLAAEATNGHHSYMTDPQAGLVEWLLATTRLIPVTARSTKALARTTIPFREARVCANGAVILGPGGDADTAWQARTAAISRRHASALTALDRAVSERNVRRHFRHWIVEEAGAPIYFCVKSNVEEAALDALEAPLAELAGAGFLKHRNGNNLSFTPAEISKKAAVEYLIDLSEPGSTPVLGIGDSLTDLPFMSACDMLVVPAASQIHETLLND